MFEKRSNVERLLREFPWLWAVNSSWDSASKIRFSEFAQGSLNDFLRRPNQADETIWIISRHDGSWYDFAEEVDCIRGEGSNTRARDIMNEVPEKHKVLYLVYRSTRFSDSANTYTIIRTSPREHLHFACDHMRYFPGYS